MQANGTDLLEFTVVRSQCPGVVDSSQKRDCVFLGINLKNSKNYQYTLFEEECMTLQKIEVFLNENFTSIKGRAKKFSVVKEAHPGYLGFTFAGNFKRLPGEEGKL